MLKRSRPASPYDESFYANVIGDTARDSSDAILPLILDLAPIRSAVDVGCGSGDWLDALRRRGIDDVLGIEGDWAGDRTPQGVEIVHHDLAKPLTLNRTFDLVISLEVAEHLPATSADDFVDSLARLGPLVCFSAAIPFQGGVSHVNEQWPDYWTERFARHRYRPIDCIRPAIWNNSRVAWWYAQNLLLFVSDAHARTIPRLAQLAAETDLRQLARVHPRCYQTKIEALDALYARPDPTRFSATTYLKMAPLVVLNSLRSRLRRVPPSR